MGVTLAVLRFQVAWGDFWADILIRSNYFTSLYYNFIAMKAYFLAIILGLAVLASANNSAASQQFAIQPNRKGNTWQASIWPRYDNNWAGRFSCNNCDPFQGDVLCTQALPILCIVSAKTLQRPLYKIAIQYTPFSVVDGGYYEGWTGGVFAVTQAVTGNSITSYQVGDQLCKGYFGNNAKFAEFSDGYYMPYMNQEPEKAFDFWDWSQATQGGWNFWGYFNHHYRGRAWVWVNGQPNGNCGN